MTPAEQQALRVGGEAALRDVCHPTIPDPEIARRLEEQDGGWDALDRHIQGLGAEVSHWQDQAKQWQGVAGNLAQIIENRDGDGVLLFSKACRDHGLKGAE